MSPPNDTAKHTTQFYTDEEKNIFIRSLLPISAFQQIYHHYLQTEREDFAKI